MDDRSVSKPSQDLENHRSGWDTACLEIATSQVQEEAAMGAISMQQIEAMTLEYYRPVLEKLGVFIMERGGCFMFPTYKPDGSLGPMVMYFGKNPSSVNPEDWEMVEVP